MAPRFASLSSEIPPGGQRRCEVGGVALLLVRLDDGLHAVQDRCPHRGASLSESKVEEGIVTCRAHYWSFDVRSGACLQVPTLGLDTYRVHEKDGEIHVDV